MSVYIETNPEPRLDTNGNVAAWATYIRVRETDADGEILVSTGVLLEVSPDDLRPLADWTDSQRTVFTKAHLEYLQYLNADGSMAGPLLKKYNIYLADNAAIPEGGE